MNPWGWLFVALAVIAIYIGIKGTENSVYAFITGNQVKPSSSSSSSPIVPNSVFAGIQNGIIGAGNAVKQSLSGNNIVGSLKNMGAPAQYNRAARY